MEEVWKDIEGFDYNYQISNKGNVRCLDSFQVSKRGENFKQSFDSYGYKRVRLTLNGKSKTIKTHRLVAKYFLDGFQEDLTVNHKDFNKSNNCVSNLEMVTATENVLHYQEELSKKLGKKEVGVTYHMGIGKWVARATYKGERYGLGVYDTEEEAIRIKREFDSTKDKGLFKIGKGSSRIGKSKYSEEDNEMAIELSKKVGIRKAGRLTGMGSTRISLLRKEKREKYGKI